MASINPLSTGLRRTSPLPKRFLRSCDPLWHFKKSTPIGANLGSLGSPTDESGNFSRASGSTLANYSYTMGLRPDVAILRAVTGALPFLSRRPALLWEPQLLHQ